MVVEWLFSLISAFIVAMLGLLPDLPDISALSGDMSSAVGTLSGYASSLGNFVPWTVVKSCIAMIVAALALGLTIKIVRIVASFFTAGGGSAA